MPFGSKIFELARDELSRRKNEAEIIQREHRDAFAAMRPQYLEIEKKMKESAFGVLKVIGMGENASKYIDKLRDINLKAQSDITALLKDMRFKITGTTGFANSQVTAGGLDTAQFNCKTMESRDNKGIYAIGEILDIDGDCGGFNLQWAWSSALCAAENIAGANNKC